MKNRRLISWLVLATLVPLSQAQARPEFDGHGDYDFRKDFRHHDNRRMVVINQPAPRYFQPAPHFHGPSRYNVMPPGYKTVIAAGVTYFVLNELWYRMHGGVYEQVSAPASSNVTIINNGATTTTIANTGSVMNVVDVNGERFYVQNGRYYRRTPDGQYFEVSPPSGLR